MIRSPDHRGVLLSVLLLLLFSSGTARAVPLDYVWPSSTRGDIKVYLCTDTFSTWFPSWDQARLAHNVRLAIEIWNAYSGVDFRMRYMGARTGTGNGCSPSQYPSAGEITVKAEESHPGSRIGGTSYWPPGSVATISLYRSNAAGSDFVFTFDNQAAGNTIISVLVHEFGHALGFPDVYSPPVATVMNGHLGAWNRVLWHEDIVRLRDTTQSAHYSHVTTRQIRHQRSANQGQSWTAEGNLLQYTNSPIGVTYNASAGSGRQYLIAWRGTNGATTLNTIQGNGATYDSSTHVVHGKASDYGPCLAYGNGLYLMAHVHTGDQRTIEIMTSSNGTSWSGSYTLQYQGGTAYGSMWEPVCAYSQNKQVFIVGWTNWRNVESDDALGRMRFCTSANPATQNFSNCIESSNAVNSTPGLTCRADANECMVTWTNHTGTAGHQICYRKASINASNAFQFTGDTYCVSDNTKLSTTVAHGGGYYVMGWQGADGGNKGNTVRQSTWPNWGTKVFPDSPLQTSPTLVYGTGFSEFAFYYIKR